MSLKGKLDRWLATRFSRRMVPMRNRVPIVSFTFDDFPESAATIGGSILEDRQARGTFYLAGALLGRLSGGVQMASHEQVGQLLKVGHEIGCHTFTHTGVPQLGPAALTKELSASAAAFSQCHGGTLTSFSYPFGSMNLTAKRILARRFTSCRSAQPGIHAGKVDLACLKAIRLYDLTIDRARLDTCMSELVHKAGWLIFYTHDVSERPTQWGCSPRLIEYALDRALALGIEVLTVRDALEKITFGGAEHVRGHRGSDKASA